MNYIKETWWQQSHDYDDSGKRISPLSGWMTAILLGLLHAAYKRKRERGQKKCNKYGCDWMKMCCISRLARSFLGQSTLQLRCAAIPTVPVWVKWHFYADSMSMARSQRHTQPPWPRYCHRCPNLVLAPTNDLIFHHGTSKSIQFISRMKP